MANEAQPIFRPGAAVTAKPTANVTGKTFVKITGTPDADGLFKVGPATAGVKPFGVAAFDAATGKPVTVLRGGIIPVPAGAAIAFGVQVELDATARPITLASGVAVGTALSTVGAAGTEVIIALDI